jgi:hypothetical protein
MATAPVPAPPSQPPRPGRLQSLLAYIFLPHSKPGEIIVVSHSHLFYWWPVWLFAFIMAIWTAVDNKRMAIVPPGTKPVPDQRVAVSDKDGDLEKRDVLVLPKDAKLLTRTRADGTEQVLQPNIMMASSKDLGILFVVVLLLVIFITNVPLRGLWSVFIIISIILLSIIFAQAGIWDRLLNQVGLLAIHINLGGYLFIAIALFVIWIVNFLFFDRQIYMIFTPGQVRVHLEIGAGETVYGTEGMVFQKQRSDLFRHWILGFGSGDLIVRPGGGSQHIDLPNVLAVGRRVRQIEKKLAEKEVVQG